MSLRVPLSKLLTQKVIYATWIYDYEDVPDSRYTKNTSVVKKKNPLAELQASRILEYAPLVVFGAIIRE